MGGKSESGVAREKAIITGAPGFIGVTLCKELLEMTETADTFSHLGWNAGKLCDWRPTRGNTSADRLRECAELYVRDRLCENAEEIHRGNPGIISPGAKLKFGMWNSSPERRFCSGWSRMYKSSKN